MEMAVAAKHCPSAGALPALLIALALIVLAAGGCAGDNPMSGHTVPLYMERSSPANVLFNLQAAYRGRDVAGYAGLLAEDYQFYFDQATRDLKGLPVFWTRLDDTTAVRGLFNNPDIAAIRMELPCGSCVPVRTLEIGREQWVRVDVTGGFIEIDCGSSAAHPQGQTRRFDLGLQHFFFRRGRTPADTDTTTSETARLWYIVEWDAMSGPWPGRPDSLRCQP
jgi:hypothetical protein